MPRMLELIRASAVPSNLMQSAARGALSVPPQEMIVRNVGSARSLADLARMLARG